jgi:hypothetical protein
MISTQQITTAVLAGMETSEYARATGCGRVYVSISTLPTIDQLLKLGKKERKAIEKRNATQILPLVESALNGTKAKWIGDRIYIGYDNCTGKELAQGAAVARELGKLGINASMVAEAD